jgi:hypothetical protein
MALGDGSHIFRNIDPPTSKENEAEKIRKQIQTAVWIYHLLGDGIPRDFETQEADLIAQGYKVTASGVRHGCHLLVEIRVVEECGRKQIPTPEKPHNTCAEWTRTDFNLPDEEIIRLATQFLNTKHQASQKPRPSHTHLAILVDLLDIMRDDQPRNATKMYEDYAVRGGLGKPSSLREAKVWLHRHGLIYNIQKTASTGDGGRGQQFRISPQWLNQTLTDTDYQIFKAEDLVKELPQAL